MQNIWFFVVEIDVNTIEDSDQTLLNLFLTDARTKAICFAKNCWNYVYTSAILGTPPHNCCNKMFTAEFIGNESPDTIHKWTTISENAKRYKNNTIRYVSGIQPSTNHMNCYYFWCPLSENTSLAIVKKILQPTNPAESAFLRQFHIQQKICNMNWYPGGWAAMDFQFWYVLLMFC